MQEELLKTYNSLNQPIGESQRSYIHSQGLWHRSVNFLVIDHEKETAIFQDKQTLDEYSNDSFFIKMNGGHALGGDMEQEFARELEEEFGLSLQMINSFHFLGVYQISFETSPTFINRELMYFYLVSCSNAFNKIKMDEKEVKAIFEVKINDGVDLLVGDVNEVVGIGRDIQNRSINIQFNRSNFKNFTNDALYLRIFLAMQDYCAGRATKYIVL